MNSLRLLCLPALLCVAGCSATDPFGHACTLEARAGITLTVVDSVSGANVGQGAQVRATDGAFVDSVGTFIGTFGLAYERAGTYTVTVNQSGYRTWTQSGIVVSKDECHVKGVAVTAKLQK